MPCRAALAPHAVRSYRTISPLPLRARKRAAKFGGLLSVALSVGLRRPGVTWHLALWSPDFPRRAYARRDCPADSARELYAGFGVGDLRGEESGAFVGLLLAKRRSKAFTGLRPARHSHGRKRPDALRRAHVGAAPAAPIRCASRQPQAGAELAHPCVRSLRDPPRCARYAKRLTAHPCATCLLFRFIPSHHGNVGSAPSALDPTYAHAHVGRFKSRPLLCIHARAALAHPCAAQWRNRHQCLFVVLLPLRHLRSLRTGALRFSRVPSPESRVPTERSERSERSEGVASGVAQRPNPESRAATAFPCNSWHSKHFLNKTLKIAARH